LDCGIVLPSSYAVSNHRREVSPKRWKILFFYWVSGIFGINFGIKLMEWGEEQAQINYIFTTEKIPDAGKLVDDELAREQERLSYVGSGVLGLNDALVELTSALTGFTFALQNTRLIALGGLITGIAASEYLSTKSEGRGKAPSNSLSTRGWPTLKPYSF
jgi:VIT1/CCC1 family predicted Fe2+/Mn2+ transporter